MNADESCKECTTTKYSEAESLTMLNSQQAISSKQSIDSAANTNVNHSNKDDDRTELAQRSHTTISTHVATAPNPVVGDQRQSASGAKRVIRKVMVIDSKKLQQSGLDRKLAEAIGRQKLKALAKEQKGNTQIVQSINGSNSKSTITATSSEGTLSTIKISTHPAPAATVTTTYPKATTSKLKPTAVSVAAIKSLPTIKKLESVKNVLLTSPIRKIAAPTNVKSTTPGNTVSKSPAPERKVFVTPKITITRPGEEVLPLRITPENRLENVKYILQCKILKRQQLATEARQASHTLQSPTASTTLSSPSQFQTPLFESKVETAEFINSSKPMVSPQPSPAKSPQDIARALDFNSVAATVSPASASSTIANESKVKKDDTSDSLRIKNYSLNAPKASTSKAETLGTRAIDVARLVARTGNASMRKDLDQPSIKAGCSKRAVDIPNATITFKNQPVEIQNNESPIKKAQNLKKDTTDKPQMPKLPPDPLPTLKNSGLAAANKTVKLVYKAPVKRPTYNETGKSSPAERNAKQHHTFLQLKDFAAFSALKQPVPVVINPLSLSPNTTLKILYKAPTKQPSINENSITSSANLNTPQRNEHIQLKNYPVFSSLKQPASAVIQSHDLSLPSNTTVKLVYKAPSKQAVDNEFDKPSFVDPNLPRHNEILQFKDFPAFSPLKQPFPVVTHSQDLPLPTISTLKKPFPTSLIKVGQMAQPQNNSIETARPENSMKLNYVVTTAEEARLSQPPKSLIVLENKVLSQDEKIDLTALGLGTPKMEPTSEVHETDETLATPYNVAENKAASQSEVASSSTSCLKDILPDVSKLNNRTILSIDKLKLSAEKIAELVNFIKTNKDNSKQVSVVRKIVNTSKTTAKCENLSKSNLANEHYRTPTTRSSESSNIPAHSQSENNSITTTTTISTSYEPKAEPLSDPESQSDAETQFKNPLPRNAQKTFSTDQFGCNKSSVCVIDSGDESDVSISAVDFIASLAAEHPITEDMKLELSPEELNLNASFASNFSPLRIPNRVRTESIKSEITEQHIYEAFDETCTERSPRIFQPETVSDDVQIGKIITINDRNILKAIAATKISNEATPTEMQEVFKLTKSTDFLERAEEEAQLSQSRNINDLDIVNTDSLSESAVGPILVKNIEIGSISNFEKTKPSQVTVKNIEAGTTACFGRLCESEDAAVVGRASVLTKSESSNHLAENSCDNDRNTNQPQESTLDVKTTRDKVPSLEDSSRASFQSGEKSKNPLSPSAKCVQESKEMPSTENTKPKTDQVENSPLSALLNDDGNIESSEKIKLVEGETCCTATKRLPRFKKGKVNLVQRKKTVGTAQETKEANVTEIVKEVKTDQKEIHQASVETPSNEKLETLTEGDLQSTGEKPNDVDLKQKSFLEATSNIEEISTAHIKQTAVAEHNKTSDSSDIPVDQLIIPVQVGGEPQSKSRDLKRKIADIPELLHPPKMPKRKSAGAEVNPDSSKEMPDRKMNNILVAAVKAATAETELTPAKIPFKKAKIEENVIEQPVKGIQNLLTKFNKDKEKLTGENIVEKADISEKLVDASKLAKEQLGISIDEPSAKNQSKTSEKAQKATKHNVEQSSKQNSQTYAENKTERSSCIQETKLNSNIATSNLSIASNAYDNVNVTAKDKLEVNTCEDINGDAKLKSDFLGFDHSSPSTHSIESNLQHILIITNSAEKAKTRDENYTTAERESPHAAKNPKKSWLTTAKTTPKKWQFGQVRKSSNRRSVPLKKRWGVTRESDGDIDITDDTSPADDDEDSDKVRDYEVTKKFEEASSTQNKEVFENGAEERKSEFFKSTEKPKIPNDIKDKLEKLEIVKSTDTVSSSGPTTSFTASKKRDRSPRDGTDARKHATTPVNISENAGPSGVETPIKKIRIDVEIETDQPENKKSAATKASKSNESPNKRIVNIPEINDGYDPTNTFAANVRTRRSCSRASDDLDASKYMRASRSCSRASLDIKEHNEEANKKPKAKRGRKPKAKVELSESSETMTVANMESAQVAGKSTATFVITEPANDSSQIGSTEDFIDDANTKSKKGQKRSTKFEIEETVVKEAVNETGQSKSGKKRGRPKTKVADASESVSPQASKEIAAKENPKSSGRKPKTVELSTSISGAQIGEEFAKIYTEVVEEAVGKTADSMARKQVASKSVDSLSMPNQKLASSTPSTAQLPADGVKKARRNRKSLGEIVVTLAKNQAENDTVISNESTPIVGKKRARKPKSLNMSLPSTTESVVCNGVAEQAKNAENPRDYIRQELNGSTPESSINATDAIDSTANVSQTTAEFDTPVKIPKKRGRKPKALLATPETPGEEHPQNPTAKPRRTKVIDLETRGTFNERLLLVTKRTQLDTGEVLTAEPVATTSSTKNIVCGLCLLQMVRDTWLDHLATHYGVGWIVGEATPTNVTIRNEVLKAMAAFLKITAGRYPLTCRMCQRTFRSALGALLHIELCGATDARVPCDYCNREYSKFSVTNHMRECSKRMTKKLEEANSAGDTTEPKEAVFNNVGRMKRASVQKAEKILKAIGSDSLGAGIITIKDAKNYIKLVPAAQFENIADKWTKDLESLGKAHCPAPNCSFDSQELTTLQTHFECCELKEISKSTGVYICQLCVDSKKTYTSSKHAIKHVLKHHKHTEHAPDFEAEGSDCGVKTDDESSSDDDDLSSGVNSNEESAGYGATSSCDEEEDQKNAFRRRSRKTQSKSSATNTAIMERLHPLRNPNFSRTVPELWNEFTSQNYSTQPLFTDIKELNYTICARADFEQYLPRAECSMKFNFNPKLELTRLKPKAEFGKGANMEWSQLQRFEMCYEKNDHLIFLGEAIKIVSWVPLPADIREQYLLVTTRREYTRYTDPKIGNTLLWLYKVTPAKALEPFSMQLHYAINIRDGPVHCLAFLPSGGYDASANRLGLVAIGTPTSTIKVYALPLIVEKELTKEPPLIENPEQILQSLTTIQLQPVWLLTLDISKDDRLSTHPFVNTQCSSLCWSEFSEHKHVFAGYTNGCVSYWDVSSDMNLNRFVINGVPNYVPINFFYTRAKNVRALALHYDSSGVRALAISVGRRILFFFDLHQIDRPLLLKEEIARSEVMDLEWSPIWQTMAVAVTDCLSNIGQCAYAVGPTNIAFKNETIDRMNGAVTQIHYNPLQHIFASATDTGDVVLLNLREMYLKDIVRDGTRSARAVAIMDVKSLKGEDIPRMDPKSIPPDWSFFESDYGEKYGLVFGPLTKIETKHKPQYLCDQRRPPINLIRCTRINGLRWNNNVLGKKLLALGYENGFLRILNIARSSYLQ